MLHPQKSLASGSKRPCNNPFDGRAHGGSNEHTALVTTSPQDENEATPGTEPRLSNHGTTAVAARPWLAMAERGAGRASSLRGAGQLQARPPVRPTYYVRMATCHRPCAFGRVRFLT